MNRAPISPLRDAVLERLSDLLFESAELLELVRSADARGYWWTEPHIRQVRDRVDELIKTISE